MASAKMEGLSRKQREDMDRQQLMREGALKFKAMALGYVRSDDSIWISVLPQLLLCFVFL